MRGTSAAGHSCSTTRRRQTPRAFHPGHPMQSIVRCVPPRHCRCVSYVEVRRRRPASPERRGSGSRRYAAAVRVLTVGNMYPPHHTGGYELVWRAAVEHLRAAGHEVRVLTTDHHTAAGETDGPGIHRELRWYWRDHRYPRRGLLACLRVERHNLA